MPCGKLITRERTSLFRLSATTRMICALHMIGHRSWDEISGHLTEFCGLDVASPLCESSNNPEIACVKNSRVRHSMLHYQIHWRMLPVVSPV